MQCIVPPFFLPVLAMPYSFPRLSRDSEAERGQGNERDGVQSRRDAVVELEARVGVLELGRGSRRRGVLALDLLEAGAVDGGARARGAYKERVDERRSPRAQDQQGLDTLLVLPPLVGVQQSAVEVQVRAEEKGGKRDLGLEVEGLLDRGEEREGLLGDRGVGLEAGLRLAVPSYSKRVDASESGALAIAQAVPPSSTSQRRGQPHSGGQQRRS